MSSIDHLTAFKYTGDYHLLTAAFTVETEAAHPTSAACMVEFEKETFRKLERRKVKHSAVDELTVRWKQGKQRVVVHTMDGRAWFFFKKYEFSAAWAAYPAYDHGCLVYATIVQWDSDPELARSVRDRWVKEGLRRMDTRTRMIPYRH